MCNLKNIKNALLFYGNWFEKKTTPENVYKLIYSCAFLSRILFAFPFRFKNRELEFRPKQALFNFAFQIILNFTMFAGLIHAISQMNSAENHDPYLVLGMCRTLGFNFFTLSSTLIMSRKHEKIIKIFKLINRLESEIVLQSKRLRKMFFCIVSEFYFLTATWAIFSAHSLISDNNSKKIFYAIVSVFGVKLIPEIIFIHFLNLIYLAGCFIDEIHDQMKSVFCYDENLRKDFVIVPIAPDLHSLRKRGDVNTPAEKIKKLRELYGRVHDLKEKVNETYSVFLLLTITLLFSETVFFSFVNLTLVQFWHEKSKMDKYKLFQTELWLATILVKLFFTSYVCHKMTSKASKTGIIVHRLYSEATDEETKKEVRTDFLCTFEKCIK